MKHFKRLLTIEQTNINFDSKSRKGRLAMMHAKKDAKNMRFLKYACSPQNIK